MIAILRCPRCRRPRTLAPSVRTRNEREIRDAQLICGACGQEYDVAEGIVDLLYDSPEFVRREARGLDRFAEMMRNEGWDRERILALPDVDLGYWYGQAAAMRALQAAVRLEPGRRILDVGSNTCWASNIFARQGLEVVALDIAKTELQGLRTAEYFIDGGDVFFERLLSTMFDIALADESMDYVFCCEVLHHNDLGNLRRTMRELHRVLRPGGQLLVINEPLRFPFNLKRDHGQEVAEFEGYEHVWFCHQYYLAARRAGFEVSIQEPATDGFFGDWSVTLEPGTPARAAARVALAHIARRSRLGRRMRLAYKTLLVGDVSLNMICTKPAVLGEVGAAARAVREAASMQGRHPGS
jgi:SAM-dependent methyltransferase